MQKNEFSQPTRQSNSAILIIIFNLYKNWIKRLFPILIGVVFGTGKTWLVLLVLGLFILLVAIFGIIYFYKYTFHIADNELVINKGVFKRSKINIPFERIQSINFKQTILHQLLSVVELEIDTAGSAKTEFDLQAITTEKADALRQVILASKPEHDNTHSDAPPIVPEQIKLFQLSFWELVKVGLTQNHFKSGLIPFALYFWLRDLLHSGGIELDDFASEYADPERIYNLGLLIIGILLFLYAFAAIIISLIMSIIRYFDLSLYRQEDGFRVTYGLFTKRQITIKDTKIQIFKWSDNLLRKIPGIFNMQIKQAASASVKQKTSSIHLAGVPKEHITQFLDAYFQDKVYKTSEYIPISSWWLIRRIAIITFFVGLTIVAILNFPYHPAFFVISFVLFFLYVLSYLFFRKKRLGLNDEVIHIKSGHFGDRHEIIQTHKLQGIQLNQSPFQRRKGLASLVFFTAAGNLNMPYIPLNSALKIRDIVLQIIETDHRDWM